MAVAQPVWIASHPCASVRVSEHGRRKQLHWPTDSPWVNQRLQSLGPVGQHAQDFGEWNGAVEIIGLLKVLPGSVIDEVTLMSDEEKFLQRSPPQTPQKRITQKVGHAQVTSVEQSVTLAPWT